MNSHPSRRRRRLNIWEQGANGVMVAVATPVLIAAVALVHDVGAILSARRWAQSVVDASVTNAALQLDEDVFYDFGNRVQLADSAANAAEAWVTAHNQGGGGPAAPDEPRVYQMACNAADVDTASLTVAMTCRVVVPVLLPPLYPLIGLEEGPGSVLVQVEAEAQFQYGITERVIP